MNYEPEMKMNAAPRPIQIIDYCPDRWKFADRIVSAVARAHGFSPSEFTQKCRRAELAQPRQLAMYLLRCAGLAFRVIADRLGCSDHATAMYAYRRVADQIEVSAAYRKCVEDWKARLADQCGIAMDRKWLRLPTICAPPPADTFDWNLEEPK